MASKNKEPARASAHSADGADSGVWVTVSTVAGAARFCRAGLCFGAKPQLLAVTDLDDGVLDALRAEPRLAVQDAPAPAEAAAAHAA